MLVMTAATTKIEVKAWEAYMNPTVPMSVIVAAAMRLTRRRVVLASMAASHMRRTPVPETGIETMRVVAGRAVATVMALAGMVLLPTAMAGMMPGA